jgi:glucose-1-phosphate thymidylyltransferase
VSEQTRQLVFICGGRGTRLRGVDGAGVPKSLTEIAGEPIVRRLIRQFGHFHTSGPGPIVIVAQGDAQTPGVVRDALGSRAIIVEQEKPDGVANAIRLAQPHVVERALVFLGDVVLQGAFSMPLPTQSAVCLWRDASPETISENFGVVLRDGAVTEMVEKPADPAGLLCGIGVYALTREAIALFATSPVNPAKGEREITEALRHLVRHGVPLGAFEFSGRYININRVTDRARADVLFKE